MDAKVMEEALNELFPALEALETQSGAMIEFLKERGIASDNDLAPFVERAANASSVRWRAARLRINHLLSAAAKAAEASEKKELEEKEKKDKTEAQQDRDTSQKAAEGPRDSRESREPADKAATAGSAEGRTEAGQPVKKKEEGKKEGPKSEEAKREDGKKEQGQKTGQSQETGPGKSGKPASKDAA
jgi:hypothetical protein